MLNFSRKIFGFDDQIDGQCDLAEWTEGVLNLERVRLKRDIVLLVVEYADLAVVREPGVREERGAGDPRGGVFVHAAPEEVDELIGVGVVGGDLEFALLDEELEVLPTFREVGVPAKGNSIESHAHRVDVHGFSAPFFRFKSFRWVEEESAGGLSRGVLALLDEGGDSEIGEFQIVEIIYEDIFRLDVAVHDIEGVVEVVEGEGELAEVFSQLRLLDPVLGVAEVGEARLGGGHLGVEVEVGLWGDFYSAGGIRRERLDGLLEAFEVFEGEDLAVLGVVHDQEDFLVLRVLDDFAESDDVGVVDLFEDGYFALDELILGVVGGLDFEEGGCDSAPVLDFDSALLAVGVQG